MSGWSNGFFRSERWRCGSIENLTERAFDIAYFWKIDPADVLRLPVSRFELYEQQTERIAEQIQPDE